MKKDFKKYCKKDNMWRFIKTGAREEWSSRPYLPVSLSITGRQRQAGGVVKHLIIILDAPLHIYIPTLSISTAIKQCPQHIILS